MATAAMPKKRPVGLVTSDHFDDDCASEGMGESEDGDPAEAARLHWSIRAVGFSLIHFRKQSHWEIR